MRGAWCLLHLHGVFLPGNRFAPDGASRHDARHDACRIISSLFLIALDRERISFGRYVRRSTGAVFFPSPLHVSSTLQISGNSIDAFMPLVESGKIEKKVEIRGEEGR